MDRHTDDTVPTAHVVNAVYDELRALASAYLHREPSHHTLQTTALVHEAWIRLARRPDGSFDNRAHYFRAAAIAMRRILLHHAERRRTMKRGGGQRGISLDESLDAASSVSIDETDLLAINEALDRLADLDAQKARVVELRYYAGCTIDQTAEALGIGTATVEREWRFARAWLHTQLDAGG